MTTETTPTMLLDRAMLTIDRLTRELAATEAQRNELAAILAETTTRYERLEGIYFTAINRQRPGRNGTIDRARKALKSLTYNHPPNGEPS